MAKIERVFYCQLFFSTTINRGFDNAQRNGGRSTSKVSLSSTTLSQRVSQGAVVNKLMKGKTRLRENEGRTLNCLETHSARKTRIKHWDHFEQRISPEEFTDLSETNQRIAGFNNNKIDLRRNESESLCELKVQYRLNGMSGSDDENEGEEEEEEEEHVVDDDADVVIEDETSDYKINLITFAIMSSVSQFLSPSTQAPPRASKLEIHMISTPSPPRTPQCICSNNSGNNGQ
ncbi:uncharacterized protein [Venturia canescens]|uniref:uncharacterized protein n=1 Tax=Venturia canescens TaxID=32260 RepID=UPI001C9CCAAB|nr:uncharacterized protein LOC122406351 [Venturia canescens]